MTAQKIYDMSFSKVYALLVAKAERKGRSKAEVDELTSWLTGYSVEDVCAAESSVLTYGDFFRNMPQLNPSSALITGKICGVDIAAIEDPLMRQIRYLDKLIDELAKGRPMEKIKRG